MNGTGLVGQERATIIGIILSVRPLIRMRLSKWVQSQSIIDCGNITPTPEEIVENSQSSEDAYAVKVGIRVFLLCW